MTALDESVTRTRVRRGASAMPARRSAVDTLVLPGRSASQPSPSNPGFAGVAPVTAPVAAPRAAEVPQHTVVSPRVQPALEQRQLWERRYRRRLRLTDTAIVIGAIAATAWVQTAAFLPLLAVREPMLHVRVAVITGVVWLVMLALFQTRSSAVVGSGPTEYKRVAHATGLAFGLLAILVVITQSPGMRAQLLITLPVGILALLTGRWMWRRWLVSKRELGHYVSRAIVVGRRSDVEYVINTLAQDSTNGYLVVGATLHEQDDQTGLFSNGRTIATQGTFHTVAQVASELGADTIIVASRPVDDPGFIRRLSWQLEGTAAELVLSSRLAEVAGPRISLQQIDGLPLIKVRIPTFEGSKHAIKRAFDIVVSSLALLAIGLATPFIALAIYIDSPGPVFFRQLRVGRDGETFRMVKFRSMKTTAEQDLAALKAQSDGNGVLFKMKNDPRITRVGRILRKFSIDELPQFFNVLIGDMSIVGPRPPLPTEVTAYNGEVFRRLYINPGITGLWQVSGRSDLSWDESVRLDLRYVENWSLMNDLMIMWRTVKVMLQPSGAY